MKATIESKEEDIKWLTYKEISEEGWYLENQQIHRILFLKSDSVLEATISIESDGSIFRLNSDHNWDASDCRFRKIDIRVTI